MILYCDHLITITKELAYKLHFKRLNVNSIKYIYMYYLLIYKFRAKNSFSILLIMLKNAANNLLSCSHRYIHKINLFFNKNNFLIIEIVFV